MGIAFVITDGEPTSGVTSWPLIQDYTRDLNSMNACTELDSCRQKWALFNFAIGGNAPMTELNKLSILNMGQAKQVFDDSEVPKVLTEWDDEFSIPLIWNYGKGVEYENVKDFDCNNNYNLFADRELVCVGPMKNPESCLAPSVSMSSSNNAGSVFSFDHQRCPIDIKCSDSYAVVPRYRRGRQGRLLSRSPNEWTPGDEASTAATQCCQSPGASRRRLELPRSEVPLHIGFASAFKSTPTFPALM